MEQSGFLVKPATGRYHGTELLRLMLTREIFDAVCAV